MGLELTQKEVADLYRVTTRTVRDWEKLQDPVPVRRKGRSPVYRLAEVVEWHERWKIEEAVAAVDTSAMDAAKLRKLEAEAESKELDLAMKRGEMVPLDEVGGIVHESLEAVDSVLRHAPSRFAPALAKAAKVPIKSARVILREVIESVRGAIREGDKEVRNAG